MGSGMILLLALLVVGVVVGESTNAINGRILGGKEAPNDATPYAVSLRVDNVHVCSGSILSDTKLLTAAHCLYRNGKE